MPCPKCGGRLVYKGKKKRPMRKLVCSNCGHSKYVSPKAGQTRETSLLKRVIG